MNGRKRDKRRLLIALGILGVNLLVLLLALMFFYNMMVIKGMDRMEEIPGGGYEDPYGDYWEDYDSGYYEPDEEDPYYEEIVDSTRTDLSYGIVWSTQSLNPDDAEDMQSYYASYPVLQGEGKDFEEINGSIRREALKYQQTYLDYAGGCSTLSYVTCMEEGMISVAFRHQLYEEEGVVPRLAALTFDLETGEQRQPEDMVVFDQELALRFRAQDERQNDGSEYLKSISDEELLRLLQDPEQAVFFYSPVGLEAGFNYESEEYGRGWISVTLKEQAL